MSWISPLEMNMDLSRSIYEGRPSNYLVEVAQKVALYSLVPFSLIVMFEAVVKNLIFINLTNLTITLLNTAHENYHACFGN
jgi:hypothetical protein